jgi:serine/threonine protein kinase
MEYLPNGSLLQLIKNEASSMSRSRFCWDELGLPIARDVANGIAHLHTNQVGTSTGPLRMLLHSVFATVKRN